jgi:hypothetical protein
MRRSTKWLVGIVLGAAGLGATLVAGFDSSDQAVFTRILIS